MNKLLLVLAMLIPLTGNVFSQEGSDIKYLIPAIDDTLWFNAEDKDTLWILWDQPIEVNIESYKLYYTQVLPSVNFGIDSLNCYPRYTEVFDDWDEYDDFGEKIKWGSLITLDVPSDRYMWQLTAWNFTQNESALSEPVWVNLEISPYSFQPRGLTIIIGRYNNSQ